MRRPLTTSVLVVALVIGMALPALAAHESTNVFDLAGTSANPDGDGAGYSIYNPDLDNWDSRVRASRLAPNAWYTFFAEGRLPNGKYSKTAVCSFMTDGQGRGSCRAIGHAEPALTFANIRAGQNAQRGPVVATATSSTDADMQIDNGEIERFPTA